MLSTLVTSMVWESVFCVATSEKSISGATVNSEQVGLDTHVTTNSSLTFDVAEAKNRPVSKVCKVIKQCHVTAKPSLILLDKQKSRPKDMLKQLKDMLKQLRLKLFVVQKSRPKDMLKLRLDMLKQLDNAQALLNELSQATQW